MQIKTINFQALKLNQFKPLVFPCPLFCLITTIWGRKKRISACDITLVTSIASKLGCTILKNKKRILPRLIFLVNCLRHKRLNSSLL